MFIVNEQKSCQSSGVADKDICLTWEKGFVVLCQMKMNGCVGDTCITYIPVNYSHHRTLISWNYFLS